MRARQARTRVVFVVVFVLVDVAVVAYDSSFKQLLPVSAVRVMIAGWFCCYSAYCCSSRRGAHIVAGVPSPAWMWNGRNSRQAVQNFSDTSCRLVVDTCKGSSPKQSCFKNTDTAAKHRLKLSANERTREAATTVQLVYAG